MKVPIHVGRCLAVMAILILDGSMVRAATTDGAPVELALDPWSNGDDLFGPDSMEEAPPPRQSAPTSQPAPRPEPAPQPQPEPEPPPSPPALPAGPQVQPRPEPAPDTPPAPPETLGRNRDVIEKMKILQELFDMGLIDKKEYETRKKRFLDQL